MKRKLLLIIFLLTSFLLGAWSLPAFSQEPSGDKPWTLDECIQAALKSRREIEFSRLDVVQAEAQVKEAQSYYYPRVNVNAGYTHFNEPLEIKTKIDVSALTAPVNKIGSQFGLPELPLVLYEDFTAGKKDWLALNVDLVQPLYTFGRIDEAVKQARIARSTALNQKEKKRREVIFEVKKAYYQCLLAGEIRQLLKEAEASADVVAKMVKIAYETAVPEEKQEKGTTRLDYLKARNFVSEVKAKLSESDKNYKLAGLALRMAMGLYQDSPPVTPAGFLEGLPITTWDIREQEGKVPAENVDLKTAELGVQFLHSREKAATKEYFPKVGLFGNYIGPEDRFGNHNVWSGGVGFTLPIFDGFLVKAKVGQARAQWEKAKGQKALLESALSAQMDYLCTTLLELKDRASILKASIKEAGERVQLAADGYASGITEYEEVLLAQKSEIETKANYLQTLFLFQAVRAEIEFVSGVE